MTSTKNKPSIVLVPGALHTPAAYDVLTERLHSSGYDVLPVALLSVGNDPSLFPETGAGDVAAVHSVIESAVEQGKDVLVLMHSLGGVLGPEACNGLTKIDREGKGLSGGVTHLFFLAGGIAPEGVNVGQFMEGRFSGMGTYIVSNTADGTFSADADKAAQYWWHDVADDVVEEQKKLLQGLKMSARVADFTTEYAAWKEIPSTYLLTEDDKSSLQKNQEFFTSQPGAESMNIVRMHAGHSPWLSRTEEVVNAIRTAAGEAVGV